MAEHNLKSWPTFFARLVDGSKTFELRRNDRDYLPGDVLLLREWVPTNLESCVKPACGCGGAHATEGHFTGRRILRRVTYVQDGGVFGLRADFVVLGLVPIERPAPDPCSYDGNGICSRHYGGKSGACLVVLGELLLRAEHAEAQAKGPR